MRPRYPSYDVKIPPQNKLQNSHVLTINAGAASGSTGELSPSTFHMHLGQEAARRANRHGEQSDAGTNIWKLV